jgi:hypothetical protein
MTKLIQTKSWLRRFAEACEAERRNYPFRFADKEVLYVQNVAQMLGCSVDHARRIPRNELPAYRGPGRWLLYLRDDVIRYLRTRRVMDEHIDRPSIDAEPRLSASVASFDAAAAARRLRRMEIR